MSRSPARDIARWALGAFLILAGISHLSVARRDLHAQVPPWLPLDADFVIIASGIVEILLGLSLIALTRWRVLGRMGGRDLLCSCLPW